MAAVLAAAAALGIAVSLLLAGPAPLSASWTGWLNSGLERYADTAGQWNSGDNAVQVALPDGRALWLFNDSFYGPVGADGSVSPAEPVVRNMGLLTSGSGGSFTVNQTITGRPGRAVAAVPAVPGSPAFSWAWPTGGIVAGNAVEAIYTVFAPYGPGTFDYAPAGTEVVTMPLASLTQPASYRIQPASFAQASVSAGCGVGQAGCIQWGIGLLNSSSCPAGLSACTYIYGELWSAPGNLSRTLVVAAAPAGDLGAPWWYDTTSGWSKTPSHLAAPLGSGSFDAGSVYQLSRDTYVVLGSDPEGDMNAYYARTPRLSGARFTRLFAAPAAHGVPGFLAYQFHIDPAYSSGTNVVVGFSVNSFAHDQACRGYAPYFDVTAYQPEFYSVTLPATASINGSPATGRPRALPAPQLHSFGRSPAVRPSWRTGPCPGGPLHGPRHMGPVRWALSHSDHVAIHLPMTEVTVPFMAELIQAAIRCA